MTKPIILMMFTDTFSEEDLEEIWSELIRTVER